MSYRESGASLLGESASKFRSGYAALSGLVSRLRLKKKERNVTELLTAKELAAALKCSEDAIRLWEKQGKIRSVRVGRLVRFEPSEVDYIRRAGGLREPEVALA